jgi:hypothetical protein
MVVETYCDLMEDESRIEADTARCLNCGNFEDRRIRTNRASSRVSRYVNPHTGGSRSLSVIQSRTSERATQTDGIIAKSPRGRTPRLPVGTSSAKTRRLEPEHLEQTTQIVQTQRRYA